MRYFALMLAAGSMLGTWIETSASTVSPQPPVSSESQSSWVMNTAPVYDFACRKSPLSKVSQEDYLTRQPDGEVRNYVRSGKTLVSMMGGVGEFSQDGMPLTVVFDPDGKTVWFYRLVVAGEGTFGWIKGGLEGDKIVIPSGQVAWYYDYGSYYTAYVVTRIKPNPDGSPETYDSYQRAEGDIEFSIDDEGIMTLLPGTDGYTGMGLCRDSSDPFLVEYGFNGKWLGYGDLETTYTPMYKTPSEGPSDDACISQYTMTYDMSSLTETSGYNFVDVAVEDDRIFIRGIMSALPQSWMEGRIEGTKAIFENYQVAGIYLDHYVYYVGCCSEENGDTGEYDWDVLDAIEMEYDQETGSLVFPEWLVLNAYDTGLNAIEGFGGMTLNRFEDVPMEPAAPVVGQIYEEYDPYMNCQKVSFHIPCRNIDGKILDPAKLYYEVYIDDELFVFTPETYTTLTSSGTRLPYNFNDGYYIQLVEEGTNLIMFFSPDYKKFAARSLYQGGGEDRYSEFGIFSASSTGVESIGGQTAMADETEYFDLSGRRLTEAPDKGIYLRTVTDSEGNRKTEKVCR